MSNVPDLTAVILGLILAAWLGVAVWAIWTGLAMKNKADATLRQSGRLGRLLETSPALPLLVRSDGKLEASQRLMHWFGFDHLPAHISELHAGSYGMGEQDLDLLTQDISLAQKTGSNFVRSIKVAGSDKALLIRGGLADQKIAPNGSALLWVFDATDSEGQIAKLRDENEAARGAFDALSALIEAAPVPMWHRSPDLQLTLVNSAYVAAVDAKNGAQVIAGGIELVETIDGFSPIDAAAKAKESGKLSERIVATTVGGERRMIQVVDVPLGKSGIAGYAIDIQELDDARREQRRFVESQRDMLDKISAGVVQFDADKSLRFCNQPFQRIFSMRPQWIAERPEFPRVLDRMREMNRIPEVRDFPEWREERTGWFLSTKASEENWLLADGTHLRVLANPTPDGGLLVIFEDRTEQVQLASARDTLLRVRTATFDNLFESLAVFAADGKLNIWNHQFANNWGLEEDVLGKHPRVDALMKKMAGQLRQPARIAEVRETVRSATTERQQKSGRLNFADGRRFEFAAIPLPDGNALFTMLDISDSYRIEQALRDRNEALVEADSIKGSFLSNMSYEFRTPLTSIGGFAELLDQGIAGPLTDQGHEYVRAILQSVKRLGTQIDNVLDLSQSEAGALPIAKDKVNLKKLIEDIASHFAEDATAKKIEMEMQLDEKLGSAMADKKRLSQTISQIVDNAIKYTDEGGRVLVYGSGDMKQALIHISDDGPGMTAGQQSKAFDSFARSRDQEANEKSGGLGLPLARQLIRAHGGDLTLTSEPGQGTLVTLNLPRQ
ncbi:PAS-domain containing protein [Parasphingorhabdus sp.]|uniref:sensor histidine kinase n=1 Tax=Parasphingorhabdus sp. TaxID=2709688 RepID=UPI0032670716